MMRDFVLAAVFAFTLGVGTGADAVPANGPAPCAPANAGRATVVAVFDHRTLILDDARVIRLANVHFPAWTVTGGLEADPARIVKAALGGWVLGRSVEIFQDKPGVDRYGRHVAHVRLEVEGRTAWLQALLAGEGLALVETGEGACAGALLALETAARDAAKGFWGTGLFRIRNARDTGVLRGLVNTFQIVEGAVTAISEQGGAVYVNFGKDWKTDFTAVVRTGRRPDMKTVLERLKQRRSGPVRVRGWLKWRNGPLIEVHAPYQIELGSGPWRPATPRQSPLFDPAQPLPRQM